MGFEKIHRPLLEHSERVTLTTVSSAGQTLSPHGVTIMDTTSTGAPFLATLGAPLDVGLRKTIMVQTVGATSPAIHINMPSSDITVDGTTADMIIMSTQGAAVTLISLSSSRWLVESSINATYSTST